MTFRENPFPSRLFFLTLALSGICGAASALQTTGLISLLQPPCSKIFSWTTRLILPSALRACTTACFLREGAFLHDILGRGVVRCWIEPSQTSLNLSGGVGVTGTHVYGLPSRLGSLYELLADCLFSVSQGLGDLFEVRGGVGFASSFFEYSNGRVGTPMVFVGVTYLGERLHWSVELSRWYTTFGNQDNVHVQKQGVTLGVEYVF